MVDVAWSKKSPAVEVAVHCLLYVPEVYWPYCRPEVMVMERIRGIQISDIDSLRANNIDLKTLAERGVEIFFTQVFRHNFFHADMHPGNLFVGDRSGIIYKVSPEREVSMFCELEPSVSAYHLTVGPDDVLFVTGPTLATQDSIYQISREGTVEVFFKGFWLPEEPLILMVWGAINIILDGMPTLRQMPVY